MIPTNPSLIILEGADGVGKSTLGKHLASYFNGMYFHATATKSLIPAMADYQKNLMENIETNVMLGNTVVMDRFWPSELVYGQVFRPGNPHGFSFDMLEKRCRLLNAMYVCCFSSSAVHRHANEKDPEHPYADSDYAKVYELYQKFWCDHQTQSNYLIYFMESQGRDMNSFAQQLKIRYNEYRANG